ncbi:hypothetical protein, partial [Salinisphaera sp. G21_0]|uniref:hypothetical protein n=1 Tax=Salinisphaera sp. G21_0 TaxID=2821094 RepID=UPI001ADA056C
MIVQHRSTVSNHRDDGHSTRHDLFWPGFCHICRTNSANRLSGNCIFIAKKAPCNSNYSYHCHKTGYRYQTPINAFTDVEK